MLDVVFYSSIYDISEQHAVHHWKTKGREEKLIPNTEAFYKIYPEFNWRTYISRNRNDVVLLHDWELTAIKHFINKPVIQNKFDPAFYMNQYQDVVQAGYNTPALAHQHWMMFGKKEGRSGFYNQQPDENQDMLSYCKNMFAPHTDIHNKKRNIIHVCSPYQPKFKNDSRRIKFAIDTMITAVRGSRHHVCVVEHFDVEDNLPIIEELIDTGAKKCVNDNDIILFTNFDICLTTDCYDRVIESCDKHGCTFSFRRDFIGVLDKPLTKQQLLKQTQWYVGADLFAFTKKWWKKNVNELPSGQLLGRPTWDWVLRIQMGRSIGDTNVWSEELEKQGSQVETPGVIYHEKHESYWEKPRNHKLPSNVRNVAIAYQWMCRNSNTREFTYKKILEEEYGKDTLERYVNDFINASVAIVGITRDNEAQLHAGIENMINIGSSFNRFKIFLYENDSIDNTKKILEQYKQQYPEHFNYECGRSPKLPGKYQQMGHARQQCINWVRQLHQVYDHVIIMDPDVRIPVDRGGVIDTFKNKHPGSWDAVFANGIYNSQGMMWDSFAFRTATYGHVFTPELFDSNKLHEKDGTGRILPTDRWTPVHSAFGGLGVYKRECFEVGNYDLMVNDCEHVGFHQSLRRKGLKKLFVNPRMIKKYSTEETNNDGYSTQGVFSI